FQIDSDCFTMDHITIGAGELIDEENDFYEYPFSFEVTASMPGTAIITAHQDGMQFTAQCKVVLKNKTAPCGDNLTYEIARGGETTVSGTGDMWNFNNVYSDIGKGKRSPFLEDRDQITSVTLGSGVTSVGKAAFQFCSRMDKITITNPDCTIFDADSTIADNVVIYGYSNSPAEMYAHKYHRRFVSIGVHPSAPEDYIPPVMFELSAYSFQQEVEQPITVIVSDGNVKAEDIDFSYSFQDDFVEDFNYLEQSSSVTSEKLPDGSIAYTLWYMPHMPDRNPVKLKLSAALPDGTCAEATALITSGYMIMVSDRSTGDPISDAELIPIDDKNNYLENCAFYTNEDGIAYMPVDYTRALVRKQGFRYSIADVKTAYTANSLFSVVLMDRGMQDGFYITDVTADQEYVSKKASGKGYEVAGSKTDVISFEKTVLKWPEEEKNEELTLNIRTCGEPLKYAAIKDESGNILAEQECDASVQSDPAPTVSLKARYSALVKSGTKLTAYAESVSGNTSEQKLNIRIVTAPQVGGVSAGNTNELTIGEEVGESDGGVKFFSGNYSLGGTTGLTISDDFPLIGGSDLSLDLSAIPATVEVKDDSIKILFGMGWKGQDKTEKTEAEKQADKEADTHFKNAMTLEPEEYGFSKAWDDVRNLFVDIEKEGKNGKKEIAESTWKKASKDFDTLKRRYKDNKGNFDKTYTL
ncbi:MAG: hypothetical protein IKS32_02035, partial [Solobacterium sp.]|nr:hypothetical protein [Solobacterium sp.]